MESFSNANSEEELLYTVILEIQYDSHSAESFWRLDDETTGTTRTVAFQPAIPIRGEYYRREINLPTGKYRLVVTDTRGDGLCWYWGYGNVTVSAVVVPDTDVAVEARMNSAPDDDTRNIEILGVSDGKFGFHLSLPFVVGDPILGDYDDDDTYTESENSGTGSNQANLVGAILTGVALSSVTVLW